MLVILAIGIFAFISLYPSGFLAIKRTGQSGAATRLAEQELERLKGREDTLPYAIVPIRYEDRNGNRVMLINPQNAPNDLEPQPGDDLGDPDLLPYVSGSNRIRRIIGERVNIPLPSPIVARNTSSQGSVYITAFAPVEVINTVTDTSQNPLDGGLLVYGNPMQRVETEAGQPAYFLQVFQYGIDYDPDDQGPQIALRPLRFRSISYKVDYAYYAQSGGNYSVKQVSEVITLPPTDPQRPFSYWVPLQTATDDPDFAGLVPDSDTVGRLFERLPLALDWDPDYPYQYKVLNDQLGLIVFNPSSSGFYERFWRGTRPLVANVDYNARDWQIINEERSIPSDGVVRLTLSDWKQAGDLLDDQSEYAGLNLPGYGQNQPDVVMIDLLSGAVAAYRQGTLIPGSGFDPRAQINYQQGVLRFPTDGDRDTTMVGRKIRVLYKVNDEWALSVQKAVHRYYISGSLVMPYDACAFDNSSPNFSTRLFFNRSEAGKSVMLREYWYADANGAQKRGSGGLFRISDTAAENGLHYIDLRDRHSTAVSWDSSVTGVALKGVQGVSLKVRLTYRPSGQRTIKLDFDAVVNRKD